LLRLDGACRPLFGSRWQLLAVIRLISRSREHKVQRPKATLLGLRPPSGFCFTGRGLEVVSKLLGHATTTITERAYAQLLDDTTRRELLQALEHPT